jgi:aminopeptidase C
MDFNWKDGGHSLLVVGYEYNNQDLVTRLKMMNSWGKNFGNDGYSWYTLTDVWNNVRRVYKFGAL